MKILDQYIGRTLILTTALAGAVVLGILSFLLLIQEFQDVGRHGYSVGEAFVFVLMQLPVMFYQLFPLTGFLGALFALSRLSSSSQLIAMRAAGVSILRIVWSVLKAAIFMLLLVTLLGEGIGLHWERESEATKNMILYPHATGALLRSIWIHQGNTFTHIGALETKDKMTDLTSYRFAPDGQMHRATIAPTAVRKQGHWEMQNLAHTVFEKNQVTVEKQNTMLSDFVFRPRLQMGMHRAASNESLVDLYRTIQYRRSIGLSVNNYIFSFWQRVLQPMTSLVMVCLAVPFVFGSFRDSSVGLRIAMGILFGFSFYMLNKLFGPITLVYQFPPPLAALIPTCIFLAIALFLLSRAR